MTGGKKRRERGEIEEKKINGIGIGENTWFSIHDSNRLPSLRQFVKGISNYLLRGNRS